MREELFEQETIDITPTWAGLLPAMLMVLEQGNAKAKQEIKAELQRMARIADLHVAAGGELIETRQQRDELLAALQAVATWWEGAPSASPQSSYGETALSVYEAALSALDRGGE